MIKKSIDKIRATNTQKKDIYERICADYEKNKTEEKKAGNKFLKYGTMAAATVLVLGAVAVVVSIIVNMQGVPVTHPESGGTSQSMTESVLSSSTESYGSIDCDGPPPPEIDVTTKPIIMTWGDTYDYSVQSDMFKSFFGIPENKPTGYEDIPDDDAFCIVQKVNYSDRYVVLAKLISSDQSPDIIPFDENAYPFGICKGFFQSVDDVIDFQRSIWKTHNKYADAMKWKGKTYAPIISIDASEYLWYRKTVIEEYGLPDPYALYKQGEWTLDAFFDMSKKFMMAGEETYAIDGYSAEYGFVATTGKALFSIENGNLVSNLYDSDIENMMDTLRTRFNDSENKYNSKNQLRYPVEIINNWTPSYRMWAVGRTLFFADNSYVYENQWQKYAELLEWDADEIQLVPFPKSTDGNNYYYDARINSYMLCTGSKNPEGYAAFMISSVLCENPETKKYVYETKKAEYGWTDELLYKIEETTDDTRNKPVFDMIFGTDMAGMFASSLIAYQDYFTPLVSKPYKNDATYADIREENKDAIDKSVSAVNEVQQTIEVKPPQSED